MDEKRLLHTYDSIEGWFDFEELYKDLINLAPSHRLIIEVGVWKGKSLSFLATEAYNAHKGLKIIGIDHFQGSRNELSSTHGQATKESILAIAQRNLQNLIKVNAVALMAEPSVNAAQLFKENECFAVFIDAEHTYEGVTKDLEAWYPKVQVGGIIAGHDYGNPDYPEVEQAVNDFFAKRGVWVKKVGSCFWVDKTE